MCSIHTARVRKLQEQRILTPLGVDKTAEWCNSFIIVSKPNGTVSLCFNPARLNKPLIWPVHKRPMLNNKVAKLMNAYWMTITDASSGYHRLKNDRKSSYLITFACQFGGRGLLDNPLE